MSLKGMGWSVVGLSILVAGAQILVLTGRQDWFWPGVVAVGALMLAWLVALVFAVVRYGVKAAPLFLSAAIVAAVPATISVYLRGCEQTLVCF